MRIRKLEAASAGERKYISNNPATACDNPVAGPFEVFCVQNDQCTARFRRRLNGCAPKSSVELAVIECSVFRSVINECPTERFFVKRLDGVEVRRWKLDVVDFLVFLRHRTIPLLFLNSKLSGLD